MIPENFWANQFTQAQPKPSTTGPWTDEPTRQEFEHNGLPCYMRRGAGYAWCGYVLAPINLPKESLESLDVHGGVTWCAETDHGWVVGFDCAHGGDLVPAYGIMGGSETYKDFAYVTLQLRGLADQINVLATRREPKADDAVALASEMLVAIVTGGGTYKQTPAELIAQVFAVADEFMAEVRRRKEKA